MVTGVIALIVVLIWGLSDPSSVTASLDPTLTPPKVAETQISSTTIATSTTLPPATVIEALAALSAYLQAIPESDGIRTDLKRDLEQRLTEVTTQWIKDRKVEKTIEKFDEFVVRVSRERRNSEIDPEPADRLIETAQQALALLTAGDTGDD